MINYSKVPNTKKKIYDVIIVAFAELLCEKIKSASRAGLYWMKYIIALILLLSQDFHQKLDSSQSQNAELLSS
jgi:hypothetical protein